MMQSVAAVATVLLAATAARAVTEGLEYVTVPLGHADVADTEWQAFLRDNLGADLGHWSAQPPLRANYTLLLYERLMEAKKLPSVLKLVLIYNNRLYWPRHPGDASEDSPDGLPRPASPFKEAFHRRISYLLENGRLTLPNVLFVYNSEDNRDRMCAPGRGCPVPLLSMFKTVGEKDGNDTDILIPQFQFSNNDMYNHPWHLKRDAAFFRGSPYCSGYWHWKIFRCLRACPRTYLAYRSHLDAKAGRTPAVLDVGLVQPMYAPPGVSKLCVPGDDMPPARDRVPLGNHTYYKWLLHMEGHSASCRLSQLLMTNSLVLFQRQPFLEYYYRSLQPQVHYVPFWNVSGNPAGMDDVYDVVQELRQRDASDPEYVQRIIQRAQTFAVKFTSAYARARYLRDVLVAYKGLFADMDSFLEGYVAQLRQQGMDIR